LPCETLLENRGRIKEVMVCGLKGEGGGGGKGAGGGGEGRRKVGERVERRAYRVSGLVARKMRKPRFTEVKYLAAKAL
jgi:hypothetical protein